MIRKLLGGLTAGAFALGILTGSAGTIVGHEATAPRTDLSAVMTEHMGSSGMGSMMSMMSGSMMGQDGSMGPADHNAHHASPTPGASK